MWILRIPIWDFRTGHLHAVLLPLTCDDEPSGLAVTPDGHFRIAGEAKDVVVYVVQTESGQETLASDEFSQRYGWKNDPQRVRLIPESPAER